MRTTSIVLLVLGLFLLVFISAMVVTYWRFQSVPDALIQGVLGAGGVEAFFLAAIKVCKIIKGNSDGE